MTVTRDRILEDCELFLKHTNCDLNELASVIYEILITPPQQRAELLSGVPPQHRQLVHNLSRLVAWYDAQNEQDNNLTDPAAEI